MATKDTLVLVTGATGQQGGGAARALLSRGARVRALVRNPQSEAAAALGRLGAELAVGDMGDRASLDAAARGADAVFSVQPSEGQPEYGIAAADELRFGKNVADAARAAGARHLIYASVVRAEAGEGLAHVESKRALEGYVRSLDVPFTIVRPGTFMAVLAVPQFHVASGVFSTFFAPDHPIPLIAPEDIGPIVAAIAASPEAFVGKTLDLVGDELTPVEAAAAIARATGRPLSYAPMPAEVVRSSPALGRLVEFAGELRANADYAQLRSLHPGLKSFEAWLAGGGASQFTAVLR